MPLADTRLRADPLAVQIDFGAVGKVADLQVDRLPCLRIETEVSAVDVVTALLVGNRFFGDGHFSGTGELRAGLRKTFVGKPVVFPGDIAQIGFLVLAVQAAAGHERIAFDRFGRDEPVVLAAVELAELRIAAPVVLLPVAVAFLFLEIRRALHKLRAVDDDLRLAARLSADIVEEQIQMILLFGDPLRRKRIEVEAVGAASRLHRGFLFDEEAGRPETAGSASDGLSRRIGVSISASISR